MKPVVLKWMLDTGNGYEKAAKQFPNVPKRSIQLWKEEHNKKLAVPGPTALANHLTLLPPPKVLPPELSALAREAARNLLTDLSKRDLSKETVRDVAIALKTLTDSYELLPPMDGKKDSSKDAPRRLVDALLGKGSTDVDLDLDDPTDATTAPQTKATSK